MEIKFNETIKVEIMKRFSKNEIFKSMFQLWILLGRWGGRDGAKTPQGSRSDSAFLCQGEWFLTPSVTWGEEESFITSLGIHLCSFPQPLGVGKHLVCFHLEMSKLIFVINVYFSH